MTLFETDIGASLQFTIFDGGRVSDLTNVTLAQLFVQGLSSPFALTIKDAVNGIVEYITKAGDFPAGIYSANIEITYTSPSPARVFTTKTFQIISKPLYGA